MDAWLVDSYRACDSIVLWLKTPENVRLVRSYEPVVYVEACPDAKAFLDKNAIEYTLEKKRNYLDKFLSVYAIPVKTSAIKRFVRWFERETRHRIPLYNADIPSEQMYLYSNGLSPFSQVHFKENCLYPSLGNGQQTDAPLSVCEMSVNASDDIYLNPDCILLSVVLNGKLFEGEESLAAFVEYFLKLDPDVISMDNAFAKLPYLSRALLRMGLLFRFIGGMQSR